MDGPNVNWKFVDDFKKAYQVTLIFFLFFKTWFKVQWGILLNSRISMKVKIESMFSELLKSDNNMKEIWKCVKVKNGG